MTRFDANRISDLVQFNGAKLDRRTLLKRAAVLGATVTALPTLLAACEDDDATDDTDVDIDDSDDAEEAPAAETDDADGAEEAPEPEDDDTVETDDEVATAGGTLNIPLNGDPTMNPFTWPNQLPAILVGKNIWSTLVKYSDEDGQTPVPDLASDWEVGEDGQEFTFTLRDDVTWHDGEPFSAEDVEFTLMNIINPDVNARFRTAMREIEEVEVPDDYTAVVRTSNPVGSMLILLGYNIAIAPKHILDGEDLNDLPDYVRQPIGTGPFQVREYAAGDRMMLDAYDDYFEGRPNIDSVVYHVIADINVVVAQLQTGELDLASIEPVNLESLEGAGNLRISSVLEPNTFVLYLNNREFPFDDVNVRKSVIMTLNRQEIVDEILLGHGQVASSTHSPAFGPFFNDDIEPYPHDLDAAAELMEEAGWELEDDIWMKDGEPFSFTIMVDQGNPTREQIALVCQQYLQDFGAEVTLEVEEWSVYIERGQGDYMARTGWRITAPDPDKISEYHSEGDVNHYGYSNPEVDELLEEGQREVDEERRVEIYHEAQEIMYEEVPSAWLYYPEGLLAINERVQGLPELGIRDVLVYTYRASLND